MIDPPAHLKVAKRRLRIGILTREHMRRAGQATGDQLEQRNDELRRQRSAGQRRQQQPRSDDLARRRARIDQTTGGTIAPRPGRRRRQKPFGELRDRLQPRRRRPRQQTGY